MRPRDFRFTYSASQSYTPGFAHCNIRLWAEPENGMTSKPITLKYQGDLTGQTTSDTRTSPIQPPFGNVPRWYGSRVETDSFFHPDSSALLPFLKLYPKLEQLILSRNLHYRYPDDDAAQMCAALIALGVTLMRWNDDSHAYEAAPKPGWMF